LSARISQNAFFRSTRSMMAVVALAGMSSLVGWGMLVAPGAAVGVRLVGLGLGAVMSAIAWRATRLGVGIIPGGILIQTWSRSRRYAWDEIDTFEVGDGNNAVQPTYTLHVLLRDNQRLRVQALSASALVKQETHVHRAARELNAELARSRELDA
jgi:hypothetical protein